MADLKQGGRNAGFPTTQWSIVLAAGRHESTQSREALEILCRTYWYPLFAFVRRRGYDADEAQDLTQAFFTVMLEMNYLLAVNQERGRFRSFLLAALKHFLANEWDRAHAGKRGGGQSPIPLDIENAESRYSCEPLDQLTPEKIFERQWALTLLNRTLADYEKNSRSQPS